MTNPADLSAIIVTKIQSSPHQRIPFASYMDLALYHPDHGYYTTKPSILGPDGDFITSPHLSDDFGQLLAVQFADMWHTLDHPDPFHLVEMGAGQGLIAADVLTYLQQHQPDCYAALTYTIIEKSPALRTLQQKRLADQKITWTTLNELSPITGCLFSNELIDAFPVHIVEKHNNQLQEVYVTTQNNTLQETLGPLSTEKITRYFDLIDIDLLTDAYPDGYRTEVNLAALDWLNTAASRLDRGFLLTIDYGHTAPRYYSPARHKGTLKCYHQHRHHDDPYTNIGQQDLTAHIDFTALQHHGEQLGLTNLGYTQQGLFLMALGLGDRIANLTQSITPGPNGFNQLIQRRAALHQLMDMSPMGLGTFGVLVQAKGLEDNVALKGLTIPPMN
ncbi:class I SAM-dependent methyltransferase [Leptolyngbya cf. ectocarpi LEGE 11479]|uniref:Class I SAM-dependent methyltransferase n=1 Tax=Leptolyngbya cf. ectocarpi LEGE 11479 TaxID=1828722 RepID=A0A928ZT73_LEPEC|nr:class I SAM-dependent methyltransferase [Leptolyngbya ectocarpi]MBE9066581.1 class I SAM-dependent methyltransferase [Leptolyngbya cf. ectocarpi LEGE 11479]